MKKRSIRFKLTLWFSLAQIAVVAITLAAVLGASQTVLRSTVRNYLIGTVEENVDSIDYISAKEDLPDYIYVPYHDGYLKIDPGYVDVVNDVETALYSKDGTMLYGSNPLAIQTEGTAFSESYTWSLKVDGVRYDLYDRKVNLENLPDGELWVRGVVPETRNTAQLNEIARLSALLLPLLLLLSLLSGWFLADRLLAPVRKIQQTAEQIAEDNDLTRRIETVTTGDEVGKLATVFNRMLDRLQHSFDSERQFTSDASHELRTPTSVILAQTDYILEKDRPAEDYKEALEVVQKQGRKMNTLIADMLDYTRMDQGAERYPFETVDLSALTAETADQMALLGTRGIQLTSDVDDGVMVNGNALLLSRMLQNLISNAYRYGKDNGHIAVSLKQGPGDVQLAVSDDGIGIPTAEQIRIFDRFYRADSSRSTEGTGLGLSMVKRIAELHGATLELESEEGVGSTFRVYFKK